MAARLDAFFDGGCQVVGPVGVEPPGDLELDSVRRFASGDLHAYSSTRAARATRPAGRAIPVARAAFKLTRSLALPTSWNGMVAGSSPRRTRAASFPASVHIS